MFHFRKIFLQFLFFPLRVQSPTKPASYSVKWTIEEKELFEQGLVNRAILIYSKMILEAHTDKVVWLNCSYRKEFLIIVVTPLVFM